MQITARKGIQKDDEGNLVAGQECTVEVEVGETLEDLISLCEGGADTVREKAVAQIVIEVQARIRSLMAAGMNDEAIKAEMANYKPGMAVRKVAVDPVVALKQKFATMSEEERSAIIAQLLG